MDMASTHAFTLPLLRVATACHELPTTVHIVGAIVTANSALALAGCLPHCGHLSEASVVSNEDPNHGALEYMASSSAYAVRTTEVYASADATMA
jgi:hypothetical protein